MDALIRCHNCQTPLRVPTTACGHRVRCTSCGQAFVVPDSSQLLEETCFTWIEHDVDQTLIERHQLNEQRLAAHRQRDTLNPSDSSSHTTTPPGFYPRRRRRHADQQKEDDPPVEVGGSVKEGWTDPSQTPSTSASPQDPQPASLEDPTGTTSQSEGETTIAFPKNLQLTEPTPHLIIENVDHVGVHFAFDACWLAHEGFRASMPICCVFCGDAQRSHLLARPALFTDQMRRRPTDASGPDLTAQHEIRTLADHQPREIVTQMGRLAGMPHPYDLAMPYYISHRYAHMNLHCETSDRRDGVTCRIVVPDASFALHWLGNVNGICGEEYQLLLRNISTLHGEAWRQLSQRCRKRISAWCKLRPREEMRLYLRDADFNRHDEGLAGLVLTDQRLVFCKFHHRGQVRRDQTDAAILIHPGNRFTNLHLRVGHDVSRMIRIHRHDIQRLTAELHDNVGLTVQMKS